MFFGTWYRGIGFLWKEANHEVKKIKIKELYLFITDGKTLERAISVFDKTICLNSPQYKSKIFKIAY